MNRFRELHRCQLRHGTRDVGEEFHADLDWADDAALLRKLLIDALRRANRPVRDVGEYALTVFRGTRELGTFVTAVKDTDR